MKTYLDLETFPRRTHYEFFRRMAFPYVGMTAKVDVTGLVRAARAENASTFLACLWAAAQAANAVPQLRQRMEGDARVELDHGDTAHTVALPDKTFCNCRTDCRMPFSAFLLDGKQRQTEAMKRHGFVPVEEDETDLIFVSCVPWVDFTQVIQPVPIPADCNPRIVFGRYCSEGERIRMSVGIQANHALVDGWHIGEFYRIFSEIGAEFLP